jgi:hypothetical protein
MTPGRADPARDSDGVTLSVNCPPRGGPSQTGAGYEPASEVELELIRMRPPVSTNMLPAAEPGSPISVDVHALRLCHVHDGVLLDQAGKDFPATPAQSPVLGACESGSDADDQEVPARAQLRRLSDSVPTAKPEVALIPNSISADTWPIEHLVGVAVASPGWGGPVRASEAGGAPSASGHPDDDLPPRHPHTPDVPRAVSEPAGAVTPGQAAPAPSGSVYPDKYLTLARAE